MTRIVYLDQNAWVTLARGAWDKARFPKEHSALVSIIDAVRSGLIMIPLTYTNIYETSKINLPARRANMALVQSQISGGRVFRSRRRIFGETLASHLAETFGMHRTQPPQNWFLSDLWFEAAADYTPEGYGFQLPHAVIDSVRANLGQALFHFLTSGNEETRLQAVRRYSTNSADLIARIESRRALVRSEPLSTRKRAYSAGLIIDELDFILGTARGLGLGWTTVTEIGSALVRSISVDVPILNVERELVVRLEDQDRSISENDLRDMMSFMTVLPLADVVVAEKQFVNLSRQARLDKRYGTRMLTSIFDLAQGQPLVEVGSSEGQ